MGQLPAGALPDRRPSARDYHTTIRPRRQRHLENVAFRSAKGRIFRGAKGDIAHDRRTLMNWRQTVTWVLLLFAAAPLHAGDWPQILGPTRNGQAENETLPQALDASKHKPQWT